MQMRRANLAQQNLKRQPSSPSTQLVKDAAYVLQKDAGTDICRIHNSPFRWEGGGGCVNYKFADRIGGVSQGRRG